MNVLPFVSAFLLIFAICSYSFVHNVRSAVEEWIHFRASHRISRKFFAKCADEIYKTHRGKDLHPSRKSSQPVETAVYHSPRDAFNKKSQTKINLRPLIAEGNHKKLEAIICSLLEKLYFFAFPEMKELEKEILKILVKALKEHPECTRFDQLLPYLPKENYSFFYKLIRGTQNYKIYTTIGYPPIGDFISLEKMQPSEPPIHFCHASRPILEATFGMNIAPLIINEEKHKWEKDHKHHPMKKQDLEALLLSHRLNPADYESLFSFTYEKNPSSFDIIHDLEAKIQIKLEK